MNNIIKNWENAGFLKKTFDYSITGNGNNRAGLNDYIKRENNSLFKENKRIDSILKKISHTVDYGYIKKSLIAENVAYNKEESILFDRTNLEVSQKINIHKLNCIENRKKKLEKRKAYFKRKFKR